MPLGPRFVEMGFMNTTHMDEEAKVCFMGVVSCLYLLIRFRFEVPGEGSLLDKHSTV